MDGLDRRRFVTGTAAFGGSIAAFSRARGEDAYPSRRIQIVVPFPPGGSADFFARVIANAISPSLGQSIIIDNKPGAGGIIGTKSVIAGAPDGYTLLVTSTGSLTVAPSLTSPEPFDPLKDVTPISGLGKVPALLVARPGLGVHTVRELIDLAKANPGKITIASSGNGTIAHLAAELLKRDTQISLVHVPYRGAPPAVNDLLGGHADVMFSDLPFFLQHVKAGNLVALAIGATERSPSLPEVPTTAEAGFPNLLADNVYCLFGPPGLSRAIGEKLSNAVSAALREPAVKEAFANQAAVPVSKSLDDLSRFVRAEYDRWVPLANATGAKSD